MKYSFWGVQFSSIFTITPQLYMFFTSTVSHAAIDIAVHFYGMIKFSEHNCNCQLSYSDHSGHHYIKLGFNWETFATCFLYYMKWIATFNTLCQKSMLICVISDINQLYTQKFLIKYTFRLFLVNLGVQIRKGDHVYNNVCYLQAMMRYLNALWRCDLSQQEFLLKYLT